MAAGQQKWQEDFLQHRKCLQLWAQPPTWPPHPEEGAGVTPAQSWDPGYPDLKDRPGPTLFLCVCGFVCGDSGV